MALQKQSIPVNFALGLDQKTDPKQIKVGRFLGLENRVFNKEGLLEKSFAFDAYGQSVITPPGVYTFSQIPASVAAGRMLAPYADELLLNDGLNLYSLSESADNWVYKGRVEPCQVSKQSIYKNQQNNILADSAINSTLGFTVFAWESWTASPYQISASPSLSGTLNGVQISLLDSNSQQTIFNGLLASTTSRPKCVSVSNKLYVLYYNSSGTSLYAQPVTQSGFGSAIQIITNIDTTIPNYDVIVVGTTVYVAYNGTGSTVKVASFDANMAAVASASKAETAPNGVGLFNDTSNNIWVAYNNGTETKAFIMNSALAVTVLAPTVVDNGSGASGVNTVTGVYDGTRGIIYYDKPGGPKVGRPVGDGGENYFVSASFVQPAVGATVNPTISGPGGVFDDFFANNSIVYIPTGGYYYITGALVNSGSATLANLGFSGNAAPGATVASTWQIVYSTDGFQDSIVTFNTLTAAGVAGSAAILSRSIYLAGKAFLANSVPHVIVGHDSDLQSTYFACALYNVNSLLTVPRGVCVAKIGQALGGTIPYRSILPSVNTISTGNLQFAFAERSVEFLRSSNNVSTLNYYLGVSSSRIDFSSNEILTQDLGNNLGVATGLPQIYDGAVAVEQGFNLYPETITAVGIGVDGNLTEGIYGYKIIYEWIDNLGQKHRSAPSPNYSFEILEPPVSFQANTTNGSAVLTSVTPIDGLQVGMGIAGTGIQSGAYIVSIDSTSQITMSMNATATNAAVVVSVGQIRQLRLTIPTLRITEKQNVTIGIYRTEVNGSVYYRIDTQYLTFPIENNIATDTITFDDFIGDINITGNEQLYTQQEIENTAPPSASFVSDYKNRSILIDSENPFGYYYSKQVIDGTPVEFSDSFFQNTGTIGGPLVGTAKLDDKNILFQRGQISYITGTGPSPNGANSDFADPQFVTADASLYDPRSLVSTPVGLMFKSEKGIYLLDRSLQTRYIGKAVEDYNQYTVRGALLTPTANQVRFILSNGTCLVYNYFWTDQEGVGQWAVYDYIDAVSNCVFNGVQSYVTSAGVVYKEVPNTYAGVNTYFKTGWFNLAGLIGYERAYFFYLLGEVISTTTLTLNIYYDYDDSTPAQTITLTPDIGLFEQRIFFTTGKVKSFLIECQESGSNGAGFNLSGLNLVVGLKKGYTTIRAANSTS